MRCFYLSSGLKINLTKSTLLGVGVENDEVTRYASKFFCKAGSFPIRYLGLPIGVSMNKGESWGPIIDKFMAKLSNWKAKSLSIGGRLTLIKSVLGSLGIYFFSLFKAPDKIVSKLESYCSKFF